MRFLSLALLVALAAPAALAQPGMGAPVVGVVIDDATGESIAGANVAVYQNDAFLTGAATNLDGRFEIGLRPGTYRLRISFVGYDSIERDEVGVSPGSPTDLGEIRMMPNASIIGEAEVVAEREFVEQQADRTVYNVADQAVTAGGSALETLQTLPSVEVDTDGNVSLRGNQNVAIQINGRPVPVSGAFLAALLRQIGSDKIERVEVIPNPSAKYEPDGMGGIINIELAEGTDRGLSGGLTLGGGTEPSANIGGNVSYQQGAWDLNTQYGFRYDKRLVDRTSLVTTPFFISDQLGDSDNLSQSHFLTGSALYAFSRSMDITLEGSLGLRNGDNDGRTQFDVTPPIGGAATRTFRDNENDTDGLNGDIALVFRQKYAQGGGGEASGGNQGGGMGGGFRGRGFGGPRGGGGTSSDHELAVEVRYTANENDDLGIFFDLDADESASLLERQVSGSTTGETSFQADYTRPLGMMKLETGFRLTDERVSNELDFGRCDPSITTGCGVDGPFSEATDRPSNDFDYDRQIAAAYVQGARSLGPVQVQAGLRAEYAQRAFATRTPIPDLTGIPAPDPEDADVSYASLFPSVFLTMPIGQAQNGTLIKANYSRRIRRPNTFSLNPFPSFEDTTFVRVGNPALRPAYTNSFEVGFTYRYFLTITPFYRQTSDVLNRNVFIDEDTGNRLFTFVNAGTEDSYGLETSLFGQFGPLRGFINGSVYQEATSGNADVGVEATDALTWRASTSLQAKLREGTDLQFFLFYRGPSEISNGRREGFGFSTLGLNQKLSPSLSLAARVNDVFSTGRFRFETTQGDFTTVSEFNPNIQAVSATLTWTFGSNPQRPQQRPNQQGDMGGDGFGI